MRRQERSTFYPARAGVLGFYNPPEDDEGGDQDDDAGAGVAKSGPQVPLPHTERIPLSAPRQTDGARTNYGTSIEGSQLPPYREWTSGSEAQGSNLIKKFL